MNEELKKQYKEKYMQAKQAGVKFWPDIIFKDLIATAMVFVLLVLLAMVPMVSAAENNFTQVDNRDIIIKIFNPNENELVIMGDIAKPEYSIVVLGKIIRAIPTCIPNTATLSGILKSPAFFFLSFFFLSSSS